MNYDFSNFHKGHKLQFGLTAGKIFIICLDCGVSADVEAISAKISPMDACKMSGEREVIGKQSPGVDKGGTK